MIIPMNAISGSRYLLDFLNRAVGPDFHFADLSVFRLTTNLKRATATAASQSTKPFLSCISRYSRKCFTLVAGPEGLDHLIVDVDGRRRPAIRFTRVRQHTIRGIVGLEHHFARGLGNLLAAGYRPTTTPEHR